MEGRDFPVCQKRAGCPCCLKEGRIFYEWEVYERDKLERVVEKCNLPCKEAEEVEKMTSEECS